jgi:hypothetical protein
MGGIGVGVGGGVVGGGKPFNQFGGNSAAAARESKAKADQAALDVAQLHFSFIAKQVNLFSCFHLSM